MNSSFAQVLNKHLERLHPVVPFDPATDKLMRIDLGVNNTALREDVYVDTSSFSNYIDDKLSAAAARYAIGGYLEQRNLYKRSALFETVEINKETDELISVISTSKKAVADEETSQRSIHLGTDIWGAVNTPIFAPLDGIVHSLAFNQQFGDYGATIILQHEIDGFIFHTLYGHLSKADLALDEKQPLAAGEVVGHFGPPEENGCWPPHLHFQVIIDMESMKGDYPGVCHRTEVDHFKKNCPDPDILLRMNKWIDE